MEEWLRSVGLAHLAPAFRAHRIQFEQVRELDEADLRELGLTIGDRKRFRRALASFAPAQADAGELAATAARSAVLGGVPAERRPLTVMFVDLVASSALGEMLDPEDLLEVIRIYREFCGQAIARFGGMIARVVGDGILAYFCYPVANENDPERAVRAALEITGGVGALRTPAHSPLQVHIGIATGRVIVGDLLAGGTNDPHTIVGSTPNLAARLQGMAPADGIIIAEQTHRRVSPAFICEDLGTFEIRGFALPQRIARVVGERPGRGGILPARDRLTPLIGREDELARLARCWDGVLSGAGATMLLHGEPGIGKSRLAEAFLGRIREGGGATLELAASPFNSDSPLYPFVAWIRGAASAPGRVRRRLLELLDGTEATDAETRPIAPQQARKEILTLLREEVLALAADSPLCLLMEDVHWADPSSLDLLEDLAGRIGQRRILLLLTARPDFHAPWLNAGRAGIVPLPRLSSDDVAAMVRSLFPGQPLSAPMLARIARKSGGIPLFVEEVGRFLRQQGELEEADAEEGAGAIPSSLHESLAANLDRVGAAKGLAQIAAVFGRPVSRAVLAHAADMRPETLDDALDALLRNGILTQEMAGTEPGTFGFTHALLGNAAYDSLLRDHRMALHRRVADTLRSLAPLAVEQQPERLARHLAEAGCAAEAVPFWIEAAQRSLSRSALAEATQLLRRALAALESGTAEGAAPLRLRLMMLLGPALISLKGPGSPEAQDLYARAYALCQDLPDDKAHFPVYWGWWRLSRDFQIKANRADKLLAQARGRGDPELLLQAHHCNWASCYTAGDLRRTCEHVEAGLDIYARHDCRDHARLYGNHDAKVCAHGTLAQVRWMQGRPLLALAHERHCILWAQELNHLGSISQSRDQRLLHSISRRDHQAVLEQSRALVQFAGEHGLADVAAKAMIFHGWSAACLGDPVRGERLLAEGFARQQDIGTSEDFPIYVCLWAEGLIAAGRPEAAVERLLQARAEFEAIGLHFWMSEIQRMLAEAMLASDPGGGAQAAALLTESASLAQAQGAVMLGLRTAATAARHAARLGLEGEAPCALAAALAAVTEDDPGLADIAEARRLLAGTCRGGEREPPQLCR